MKNRTRRRVVLSITLPCAVALGLTLANVISGEGRWGDALVLQTMAIGIFFGLIGAIAFLHLERTESQANQCQLQQNESENRKLEASLKLLQAQMVSHFLFNTLANVVILIDNDPALAKQLLERLSNWLRVALARTGSDHEILGDELDMLEGYLQILKSRLGERLCWRIEAHDIDRLSLVPPMLLQPLVESAVRHGIEPKIGGGVINIHADFNGGALRIEVSDTGVGLICEEASDAGLSYVRVRLASLFGDAGKLLLAKNIHGGVTATIEFPSSLSVFPAETIIRTTPVRAFGRL